MCSLNGCTVLYIGSYNLTLYNLDMYFLDAIISITKGSGRKAFTNIRHSGILWYVLYFIQPTKLI